MKKLVVFLAVVTSAALAALAVALFVPAESSQASVVAEPISVEVELDENAAPLEIDPETGLPKGALVFAVEDHTCIALPNGAMDCFCPC
ncbi:MAG: hypothetical protein GWN58_24415, partial [Anaerolineae bacterium]|nr:hypothetical protein [Anaerolineae bacterium]